MVDIIKDTEISLLLIKICGLSCAFVLVAYFLIIKSPKTFLMDSWKSVTTLSLILGLLDAGLSLSFGRLLLL